jgi:hypothetical protein
MFAVITDNPVSLLRAVKLDVDSEELALSRGKAIEEEGFHERIHLIVNLESGEIKRVYRSGDGLKTHRSAYDMLGTKTGIDFFENEMRDTQ